VNFGPHFSAFLKSPSAGLHANCSTIVRGKVEIAAYSPYHNGILLTKAAKLVCCCFKPKCHLSLLLCYNSVYATLALIPIVIVVVVVV